MSRTMHHRGYNRRRASRHMFSCGCCFDHNWNHTSVRQAVVADDTKREVEPAPEPDADDFQSVVNAIAYRRTDYDEFLAEHWLEHIDAMFSSMLEDLE